ncbi:MAG TPA: hypothetical protein DCQ26_01235 [Marinilabiliales bacterium]|nr:hypothetical protein [Ignavibacteriales bacterium]HAM97211.1 hypothetical protein [Marinilabiliales bacterium]
MTQPKNKSNIMLSIEQLKEAFNTSWCRETAYRADREYWSEQNKTRGQCTVTVMIVNDYLGGEMLRGYSKKYNLYHYWNIVNGMKIDLTFEQFVGDKDDIVFDNIVVKTKNDLLKISNVRSRYQLLSRKIDEYLRREDKTPNSQHTI